MKGPNVTAQYTLKITAYLPSRESTSFYFVISMTSCLTTPIIATNVVDQTYFVNFAEGFYEAPAFTIDAACPQTIVYSNTVTGNNFITGSGKKLSWQTDDKLNINKYTIKITATNYCVSASDSYILDVRSVCEA